MAVGCGEAIMLTSDALVAFVLGYQDRNYLEL